MMGRCIEWWSLDGSGWTMFFAALGLVCRTRLTSASVFPFAAGAEV